MKKIGLAVLFAGMGTVAAGSAWAQSTTPSSKAAVMVGDALAPATCGVGAGWATIFKADMRNSGSQKDFLVGLSGVTALMTDTTVRSSGGTKDTSEAEAVVKVRILVDGAVAKPGPVVFDRRKQTLIAKFNGICIDSNGDGVINATECTLPEELQLILDTQAAHHFNFVSPNVGNGIHSIEAQACTAIAGSSQQGSSGARAAFGKGALVVEEVRLAKNAVIEQ